MVRPEICPVSTQLNKNLYTVLKIFEGQPNVFGDSDLINYIYSVLLNGKNVKTQHIELRSINIEHKVCAKKRKVTTFQHIYIKIFFLGPSRLGRRMATC